MEQHLHHYNVYWLVFSVLLGVLFSYIALDLRWKMLIFKNAMYKLWLLGCACSMGIGIWMMHFVGMLAMEMPIVYDIRIVIVSMLLSIIGTGIAFFIMKMTNPRLFLASLFMGGGITLMHYLGISAMNVNYTIHYQPSIVILSILVALISSYGSLRLLFYYSDSLNFGWRIASSILMGLGIAGMHYSGMWGTDFELKPFQILSQPYHVLSDTLSSYISVPAFLVLFIMFLSGAYLDKKLVGQMKELKEREEMLIETEKLSLVGELASGVAHEIRNPLTTLKGFTKMIYQHSQEKSQKKYLKIMMDELDRINLIVDEFMVLAKPHLVNFEKKDLSQIINEVVTLLRTQAIIKDIEIVTVLEGHSFDLICEGNQIKQVLVNLIKNSIEAMSNGGKIYVKLEKNGGRFVVSIIDEGEGIPQENLPLLGNPFYTTKKEGTGLGLMVTKKIIQNHNGTFKITSQPNNGTRVTVSLPIDGDHLEIMKQQKQYVNNIS
ncbi:MHYT domain-containing protein [Halalkalibacter urbisdiaboli]|uniref:MHYT domain-containing protein n=1 Tax=Halalkalibacter urbisdiaboli TaxID=1960589 RepID=UPI0013FE2D54|nr:MHYT domain-containing protein [Halalkalibacter urbisdiaboli]